MGVLQRNITSYFFYNMVQQLDKVCFSLILHFSKEQCTLLWRFNSWSRIRWNTLSACRTGDLYQQLLTFGKISEASHWSASSQHLLVREWFFIQRLIICSLADVRAIGHISFTLSRCGAAVEFCKYQSLFTYFVWCRLVTDWVYGSRGRKNTHKGSR